MHKLALTKDASAYIRGLDAKQFKQVMGKVMDLLGNPSPADSSQLKGYEDLHRVDIGEHRIVYRFNATDVSVLVVGKRNDDQVYKELARKKV